MDSSSDEETSQWTVLDENAKADYGDLSESDKRAESFIQILKAKIDELNGEKEQVQTKGKKRKVEKEVEDEEKDENKAVSFGDKKPILSNKKKERLKILLNFNDMEAFVSPLFDKFKANSLVSLEYSKISRNWPSDTQWEGYSKPSYYFENPYKYEIEEFENFIVNMTMDPFSQRFLIHNNYCLLNHRLEYIENLDQLKDLICGLLTEDFFSVDLYENFDTYYGYTSIIVISTESEDYVIDPFPLVKEIYRLNEVFTNPLITKIFYDSQDKLLALQRDFGIYCVHLIDIMDCAYLLDLKSTRFNYLIEKYFKCNLKVFKIEWAERPIDDNFVENARERCQFLPHLYVKMVNQLLDMNLYKQALLKGQEYCLNRFEKNFLNQHSYLQKCPKNCFKDSISENVYKKLFEYRDKYGKLYNMNVNHVMNDRVLEDLAISLPTTEIHVSRKIRSCSKHIKKNLNEIIRIISNCVEKNSLSPPSSSKQSYDNQQDSHQQIFHNVQTTQTFYGTPCQSVSMRQTSQYPVYHENPVPVFSQTHYVSNVNPFMPQYHPTFPQNSQYFPNPQNFQNSQYPQYYPNSQYPHYPYVPPTNPILFAGHPPIPSPCLYVSTTQYSTINPNNQSLPTQQTSAKIPFTQNESFSCAINTPTQPDNQSSNLPYFNTVFPIQNSYINQNNLSANPISQNISENVVPSTTAQSSITTDPRGNF